MDVSDLLTFWRCYLVILLPRYLVTLRGHPKVWVAVVGLNNNVPVRLSSSTVDSMIILREHWLLLGLALRNVGWVARTNVFERHVSGKVLSSSLLGTQKLLRVCCARRVGGL